MAQHYSTAAGCSKKTWHPSSILGGSVKSGASLYWLWCRILTGRWLSIAAEVEEQWKSILTQICLCISTFWGVEQMLQWMVLWFELFCLSVKKAGFVIPIKIQFPVFSHSCRHYFSQGWKSLYSFKSIYSKVLQLLLSYWLLSLRRKIFQNHPAARL